jgi:hypothetical protein
MKNYRMVALLAVFALLLTLVPASFAQDMTFGLSQDDYSALMAATAATASATSAQFTFTANFAAAGEGSTGALDMTGTGAFDSTSGVFQLAVNGQADMGDGSGATPISAELRVVNGSLYAQVPAMLGPQWLEVTPEELGQMTESMTSSLPFSPDALASGDTTGMEGMSDAMMALATLQPEDYVAMVRNGDQFTTTLDITGLLGSEEIQAAIRSGIAANADEMESSGMSEAEINAMLANLPAALQGTTATLDQYVTDGMVSRMVLALALNVDPSAIGETGEAASLALTFDISLSAFNQPVTVAVPEGAVLLSEMMGGMSAGQ